MKVYSSKTFGLGLAVIACAVASGVARSARANSPPTRSAHPAHEDPRAIVYEVHPDDTLGELSLRFYGTHRRWQDIARWNRIEPPYRLKARTRLVLRSPPTLDPDAGFREVIDMWRQRCGGDAYRRTARARATAAPKYAAHAAAAAPLKPTRRPPQPTPPRRAPAAVPVVKPNVDEVKSREWLAKGEEAFRKKQYAAALEHFRKAREDTPDFVTPWFWEIRTLREMKRHEELQETTETFLYGHPEFRNLPMFKNANAE